MALPLSYFILSLFSPTFFFFFLSSASLSLSLFFLSFFLSLVLSFFLSLVQPSFAANIKARALKHLDNDRRCWVLILSHQVTSLSNLDIKLRGRIGLSPGQIVRPDASQRSEASPVNRTKTRPEIRFRRRIGPRALLFFFFFFFFTR